MVDATLIEAPSSTKNRRQERDPEMHQAKKGNQWHFGMKAHIGVDATSGLTHSVATTAAHASDLAQAHRLLHGGETTVWGDAGYQGIDKRPEFQGSKVAWQVAMRPDVRRRLAPDDPARMREKCKASVRAKACQSGASVPVREAALRIRQGALSGSGQKHATAGVAAGVH